MTVAPSFIQRDVNNITSEMVNHYETMTDKPLFPAQYERILIDVIAYREMLTRIAIQDAATLNLVRFSRAPVLDYLGELVGVSRLPAQPSKTTIRFSLAQARALDTIVPQNSRVMTTDGRYVYATDYNGIIKAGDTYVDIPCTCEQTGIESNGYAIKQVNKLISEIAYIVSAHNITTTQGGAEIEDDNRLRERIIQAPERFSVAGSVGAYKYWAMTAHTSIIDVSIISPAPGRVEIYPLCLWGNPTEEIIEVVRQVVTHEKIRPLTDRVFVLSPTRVEYSINLNITLLIGADHNTVNRQVEAKLNNYITAMRTKLGKDIVPSQIVSLIGTIDGIYKVDVIAPNYIVVNNKNEWADCISTAVNYIGYNEG